MSILCSTDVVVIGGGIVGTAIARELSKYQVDTVLLEKEPDIGVGTTKANSAILHAGFDAHPGTLKAKLNVRGNALYHDIEDELGLEISWLGSLVVAKNQDEMNTLHELLVRGKANGVPDLKILSKDEVLVKEPNLANDVLGALWAPTAGIFWPFGAAIAFAENAVQNGVKVFTECAAQEFILENGRIVGVKTPQGLIAAKHVVNAAGLYADDISRLAGDESFSIKPRKGEYLLFDKNARGIVNNIVFPAPSKVSKGILVCPTVHGNVFIGPNALDTENKEDLETSIQGMNEIIAGAKRLVPQLPLNAAITQFAGLRAVASGGDFIIRASETVEGLIHAAGIQSPGITSAPAIAEMIVEILRDKGLKLNIKDDYIPVNKRRIVFRELSDQQKQEAIACNPLYGRVICRCETVTEGEIVDAIHSLCGAKTVDGVKRRTRAGMGRCQGGFCGPRIASILARELNIPITAVRKEKSQSYLFYEKMPADCEVTNVE